MANGDTKTEAMLNVLGNGGSGDEFRGCCNTKTQQYILDAIDRINNLDPGGGGSGFTLLSDADANWTDPDSGDEMIALWLLPTGTYRFSPDATVVAALGLDTDGESTWVNTTIEKASEPIFIISNEDIGQSMASITILASNASQSANVDNAIGLIDFTDSGPFVSTDFIGTDGTNKGTKGLVPAPEATDADKFLKSDGTWDTAGGGGAGATILTTADYNYPENNPTSVALWLLPPGLYQKTDSSVSVKITTGTSLDSYGIVLVGKKDSIGTTIVDFEAEFPSNGGWKYGTVYIVSSIGSEVAGWGLHIPADRVDKNWTTVPLAASQGKALNDKITPSSGPTAPTTATVGILGKIYIDTSTDNAYMCVKVSGSTYTWKQITS